MLENDLSEKEILYGGVYYDGQGWKVLVGTETHIPYFSSNQEEADGKTLFHINDSVVKHSVQSVFIDSPDVFVILFFATKTLGIYRSCL